MRTKSVNGKSSFSKNFHISFGTVGVSVELTLGSGLIWITSQFVPRLDMDLRLLRSLIRVGSSLMATGFFYGVLTTMDR
jgi:hypothetical protein